MKFVRSIGFIALIVGIQACGSTAQESPEPPATNAGTAPLNVQVNHPLILIPSKYCMIDSHTDAKRGGEPQSLTAILKATLIQKAITSGFKSVKDYVAAKALKDTQGKQVTTQTAASYYKVTLGGNKTFSIDRQVSCLTMIVPSEKEQDITLDDWVEKLFSPVGIYKLVFCFNQTGHFNKGI